MTPLTGRLTQLETRDDRPASDGSAYGSGWYGYVEQDLRTLLGRPSAARYSRAYCGGGDLAACRASLWAAIDAAAFLPDTARWTNRPTFQQVMSFSGHRPGG